MPDYTLEGAKWPSSPVTWSFATSTYGVDASDPFSDAISTGYQDTIRWALQQWASASSLSFVEVPDSAGYRGAADIRIGFGALNSLSTGVIGETELRWDGVGSLVPDEVVRLEDPSQLALNANGDGNFTYAGTSATLRQVALHELGHALGLGHASDPNAVMYYSAGANNQTLDGTDIAGIQSLYGAPASTPAPAPAPAPSGSDVLVVRLAEDAWQGDARFTVRVDGQQLGGAQTVTAAHRLGQDEAFTFQGDFGSATHDLAISFINDAYGGTPDTDRNLYVTAASYDGQTIPGSTATLLSNGTADFSFGAGAASGGGTSNGAASNAVINVSEDAYQGDAQFVIAVDGTQAGGTYTATARHGAGQSQAVTVSGIAETFAPHDIAVTFLNDAYAGTPGSDRNLYVDSIQFDGQPVPGGSAALMSAGTQHFTALAPSNWMG